EGQHKWWRAEKVPGLFKKAETQSETPPSPKSGPPVRTSFPHLAVWSVLVCLGLAAAGGWYFVVHAPTPSHNDSVVPAPVAGNDSKQPDSMPATAKEVASKEETTPPLTPSKTAPEVGPAAKPDPGVNNGEKKPSPAQIATDDPVERTESFLRRFNQVRQK